MSLGGTYQDHHKDMFKDILLLEAQQMGSRLEQSVMIESMSGNKTFFDKLGKVSNYVKSSRGQAKNLSDITFERRQVQETLAEYSTLFDREDLLKHVSNPKGTFASQAVMELGRRKDNIIYGAIGGNAVVTTDGSAANQALTLTVAVNNHDFDSGSGDVALTSGCSNFAMYCLSISPALPILSSNSLTSFCLSATFASCCSCFFCIAISFSICF